MCVYMYVCLCVYIYIDIRWRVIFCTTFLAFESYILYHRFLKMPFLQQPQATCKLETVPPESVFRTIWGPKMPPQKWYCF